MTSDSAFKYGYYVPIVYITKRKVTRARTAARIHSFLSKLSTAATTAKTMPPPRISSQSTPETFIAGARGNRLRMKASQNESEQMRLAQAKRLLEDSSFMVCLNSPNSSARFTQPGERGRPPLRVRQSFSVGQLLRHPHRQMRTRSRHWDILFRQSRRTGRRNNSAVSPPASGLTPDRVPS
jgi:hypothetical protein